MSVLSLSLTVNSRRANRNLLFMLFALCRLTTMLHDVAAAFFKDIDKPTFDIAVILVFRPPIVATQTSTLPTDLCHVTSLPAIPSQVHPSGSGRSRCPSAPLGTQTLTRLDFY
ncbi:hypothetical protein B0H14DRAFT_2773306 [Mycena olivaceomarginata]|nr:hypothetical protein B0H14DRAFT_2773306 [Mycena olivaceomarginata]